MFLKLLLSILNTYYPSLLQRIVDGWYAFTTIHRLKETFSFHVAYFLIAVAIVNKFSILDSYLLELFVLFIAIMTVKTQAYLADVIHDYEVDRNNPAKSQLAAGVDYFGRNRIWSFLIVELVISLALWGWLSVRFTTIELLIIGVIGALSGFLYSYPPRIKERGILNHITTSAVDVLVVLYPVNELIPRSHYEEMFIIICIVFFYSFGYHILHQAADTFYDRQEGVSTFTTYIGADHGVLVAVVFYLLASSIALYYQFLVASATLLFATGWTGKLQIEISNKDEKYTSKVITDRFNIGLWATGLNLAVAVNVLLSSALQI
ncbi:UbiA family prenyltransferase [Halobellus rarus]|uniref:UbiA family prenyltransferase n=1 Tax=Halobellus rarus TaxID=1126237 RepID=A0ABD6CTN0_9EURY